MITNFVIKNKANQITVGTITVDRSVAIEVKDSNLEAALQEFKVASPQNVEGKMDQFKREYLDSLR